MHYEVYLPSAEEVALADGAYIRYIGGVAMLHDPEGTQAVHGFSVEDSPEIGVKPFIRYAGRLMVDALKDVIRYANPPELRSPISSLEFRYSFGLSNMQQTVSRVCTQQADRLHELSSRHVPAVLVMQPAPMLKPHLYRHLCHSRLYLLSVMDLLDGVAPAASIFSHVENTKLTNTRKAS